MDAMSLRALTVVWEESKQEGSALLLLLALADFADDKGRSFPSVDTLSKKARMSRRSVQRIGGELVKAGELIIEENAGPKGCNVYVVPGVTIWRSPCQTVAADGVGGSANTGPQLAPKPSGTSIEPSGTKDSSAAVAGAPQPNLEHKLFFELWDEAFQMQFGRSYVFAGGKDGMALKRLLAASKMGASDLLKTATRAWSRIGKGKQWWNCEKAVSITGFCSRFNEILAELHRPMPGDIKHLAPKRPSSGKKRAEDRPISGDPDPDTGKPLTREEIETKFPLSDYE